MNTYKTVKFRCPICGEGIVSGFKEHMLLMKEKDEIGDDRDDFDAFHKQCLLNFLKVTKVENDKFKITTKELTYHKELPSEFRRYGGLPVNKKD